MTDYTSIGITVFFGVLGIAVTLFFWWRSKRPVDEQTKVSKEDIPVTPRINNIGNKSTDSQNIGNVKGNIYYKPTIYKNTKGKKESKTKKRNEQVFKGKRTEKSFKNKVAKNNKVDEMATEQEIMRMFSTGGYMDKTSNGTIANTVEKFVKLEEPQDYVESNESKKTTKIPFDFILKPGYYETVELGELFKGDYIEGKCSEGFGDKFSYYIVDERNKQAYPHEYKIYKSIDSGKDKSEYDILVGVEYDDNYYIIFTHRAQEYNRNIRGEITFRSYS